MKSGFRNWSDVRIFLAVVREGSTLAASRKLGIAQPTVARCVEVLENEIGLTLFDRDTRGFRPTADARRLLPLAEAIEAAASDFATLSSDLTQARPIRITAYAGNFSPRINQIFSDFSARNPDVRFEFLPSVKSLDLSAGEADIALRLARTPPDGSLICRHISTAQWSLFGARSYAGKHGLPTSPDDLAGHRLLTFQRDDVPGMLHDWVQRHATPDQIVMSFTEVDLLHAAIKAGHGLGVMNLKLAEGDDSLIRCFDPIAELATPHVMLIAPQAYRRPEVKAFTQFFAPRYAAVFK